MIKKYISEHKSVLWFSVPLFFAFFYFLQKLFVDNYNAVYVPLDGKIPFIPAFVIPYVLWYLYVPLVMVFVYLSDEKAFNKQALALTSGLVVSAVIFIVYPSIVEFRPSAQGKGFLLWVLRLVYKFDTPAANVFPSVHCFDAVSLYLTGFVSGPGKNKKGIKWLLLVLVVLICASTVFIKQHSFVDVVGGILLAFITYFGVEFLYKKRGY